MYVVCVRMYDRKADLVQYLFYLFMVLMLYTSINRNVVTDSIEVNRTRKASERASEWTSERQKKKTRNGAIKMQKTNSQIDPKRISMISKHP